MTSKHTGSNPLCLPPIRLRVGVSGHRQPPKLPTEVIATVRVSVDRVLAIVTEAAREQSNALAVTFERRDGRRSAGSGAETTHHAVISSLAEGADRIVAEAGIAVGFSLESVLPFGRAEYMTDFVTVESRAKFGDLLAHAASIFELDGNANERPRAYEAAGFVMLANIDMLIAIWDGAGADGIGGTAQIVSRAISDGIPVVWIDPARPDALQLSWSQAGEVPPIHANAHPKDTFRPANEAEVKKCLEDILRPPSLADDRHSRKWLPKRKSPLEIYLRERERRWNFCPWYPLLQFVFAGRPLRRTDFHLPSALDDSRQQWEQQYFKLLPRDATQRPAIEKVLLPAFSVADHLAVYYSLVYRGAYVFNFVFAALASLIAVVDILYPDHKYLIGLELGVIVFILVTWWYGTVRQCHRRWLEYRRLAECLRHMRILAPVGSAGSISRPGHGLDADEPDWVNWYAWSLRRLLPLPNRAVDDGYVTAVRDAVRAAEITEQCAYHKGNDKRMSRLNENIEACGVIVFVVTFVTCLVLLAYHETEFVKRFFDGLTGLTALLPAAGAALGAIHVQGDFRTAAEQSRRTAQRLAKIDKFLRNEPPNFARLTDRIEQASRVMMADLRDWQTVFRTRRLTRP